MKKYSESKIKAAQKFLSKYDLSFDDLDEPQKKIIVSYTFGRKYFFLCIILFVFCFAVFSVGAYIAYQGANSGIDEISKESILESNDALHIYGTWCFGKGVLFGTNSVVAFIMLIYIFLISIGLRGKFQVLNAFLPSLRHLSGNEKTSND